MVAWKASREWFPIESCDIKEGERVQDSGGCPNWPRMSINKESFPTQTYWNAQRLSVCSPQPQWKPSSPGGHWCSHLLHRCLSLTFCYCCSCLSCLRSPCASWASGRFRAWRTRPAETDRHVQANDVQWHWGGEDNVRQSQRLGGYSLHPGSN